MLWYAQKGTLLFISFLKPHVRFGNSFPEACQFYSSAPQCWLHPWSWQLTPGCPPRAPPAPPHISWGREVQSPFTRSLTCPAVKAVDRGEAKHVEKVEAPPQLANQQNPSSVLFLFFSPRVEIFEEKTSLTWAHYLPAGLTQHIQVTLSPSIYTHIHTHTFLLRKRVQASTCGEKERQLCQHRNESFYGFVPEIHFWHGGSFLSSFFLKRKHQWLKSVRMKV